MKKKIGILLLAVVLVFSMLTGCTGGGEQATGTDDMSKEVHLKWLLAKDSIPESYPEVIEEVNKYLKEKINATLEIQFLQPGDFNTNITNMMAAQDDTWDLVFTSNWRNPFEQNADKGGYYDIKELLKTETPDLYEFYPEEYWDAVTMADGGVYAVPNNQIMAQQPGLWFHKELAAKYGLEEQIAAADSLEDLTAIYEVIAQNEPDIQPYVNTAGGLYVPLRSFVEWDFYLEDDKVLSRWDEDNFEANLAQFNVCRDWYVKKITPQDPNFNYTTIMQLGKGFSGYQRILPGVEAKHRISYDYDIIAIPTGDTLLRRQDVQQALTAINRVSKNPARALKLIELMATDEYLFNLMAYGIEGVNYTKEGNHITPTENDYYIAEFTIGNQFLAYLLPGYEDGIWEATDKLNKEAAKDPYMNFVFNKEPAQTEIANLASATEYSTALDQGTAEDVEGTIRKHMEKVNAAGYDTLKDEIEKQFAEWKAAQ